MKFKVGDLVKIDYEMSPLDRTVYIIIGKIDWAIRLSPFLNMEGVLCYKKKYSGMIDGGINSYIKVKCRDLKYKDYKALREIKPEIQERFVENAI